jgi:hypothetical protein
VAALLDEHGARLGQLGGQDLIAVDLSRSFATCDDVVPDELRAHCLGIRLMRRDPIFPASSGGAIPHQLDLQSVEHPNHRPPPGGLPHPRRLHHRTAGRPVGMNMMPRRPTRATHVVPRP